ncbi:MAG: ATP-grasp domain-containing protein [Deltaproteobacteria bacterium]|nr:ATP-grasp domain-containing protein [Deltaproteobacteria bacterium]
MDRVDVTVAVTGMNATDNPAPGVPVARALRHEPSFKGRIIGLGYDALDPGFYAEGLVDGGAILPYPSAGREALRDRLRWIRQELGTDVLVPNLDSELRALIALAPELERAGTRTFLPSLDSLERSSKTHLPRLAAHADLDIPPSEALLTADGISDAAKKFGLPLVVKGVYYGAVVVHTEAEGVAAFHRFAAQWGVPVIVQQYVPGEEYNVAALGDGKGNLAGAVAMRKMMLTDKGKGWCGVAIDNPELIRICEAVVGVLRWRGPLEVEILRGTKTGEYFVIEINPRFPAWIHLSAGAGLNLPYYAVRLALGLPLPSPIPHYRAGTLFVRIAIDQITDLSTFEQLAATGVLRSEQRAFAGKVSHA